jgi:hypothetical protein
MDLCATDLCHKTIEIPLAKILLDRAMCGWLKKNADAKTKDLKCKKMPPKYDNTVGYLSPNRILSIRDPSYRETPIQVIWFRDTSHYEVIDGRHRVVLAIQRGDTTIQGQMQGHLYA